MPMIAQRLNLRCFIDGVEVPVIGCRATFSEGGPATAEVQLVPTDQIYDIEPRAKVTLFYYETHDYDRTPSGGLSLRKLPPWDLRRWKLLYDGEYVSIAFQKQSGARAATIMCVDHTNYWDAIKQHYINFSNGGVEMFENAFLGVKLDRIKNFDVITKDLTSNLYVWLTQSKGANGKPNLYLGVQRILREMWFAANDFYARAFNRLRVGDQIVGIPSDETAAKLFELEFFKSFISNQIGGGGSMVNVRQMVDSLLGAVFHTYVTIPAPFFDRKGRAKGFSPSSGKAQDEALLSENIDRSESWPEASLNYTVIKPDTTFLAPPACNIIFPHQYTSLNFQRNFLQEPTRLFLRSQLLFNGQNDKWVTERFYAPDFEEFNKLFYKEGGYLSRLAGTVLGHEDFVGINALETWQSDLGAYVQKDARRTYLAQLTNYLFWKTRFAPRAVDVSGPFNPNVIPGYPGLVMDAVSRPGQLTRHYLGNVQTVTHVINQAQGGWTHISMTGAHVHDETADFDAKGRSLEEVTNRGTDGFLDERYHTERIGEEVYQLLFGCGSLYDIGFNLDIQDNLSTGSDPSVSEDIYAQVIEQIKDKGQIAASVETVHLLYQTAVRENADIHALAQSITWRPKANLVEMMGINIVSKPAPEGNGAGVLDFAQLAKEDPDLFNNEGFLVTCVDPEAFTTINAEFTAVTNREVPVTVVTKVPEVKIPVGNQSAEIIITPEKTVTSTTWTSVQEKKKGNYQLAAHLKARQSKVLAYVDSLKNRGIRG